MVFVRHFLRPMLSLLLILCAFTLTTLSLSYPSDLEAMVLLTMDWSPKDPSWTPQTPVCQWVGVTCNNQTMRVTQFIWSGHLVKGTFNTTQVPSGMQFLSLYNNQLSGTPDLSALPTYMQTLDLGDNLFTGQPNLSNLPKGMQYLYLGGNKLSGNPDLSSLPMGLQYLYLYNNQLSGTPDLSSLPDYLQTLDLRGNQLSGTPNFSYLPMYLQYLWLGSNQLSGTPNFSSLPLGMYRLDVSNNQFCGTTISQVTCTVLSLPDNTTCIKNKTSPRSYIVTFPACQGDSS